MLELAALAAAALFVALGAGDLIAGAAARELPASEITADTGSIGARATDERPVDSGSAKPAGDAILARNIFDSVVGPIATGGAWEGACRDGDCHDDSAPTAAGGLSDLAPCDERKLDVRATVSAGGDQGASFALLDDGERVTYLTAGDPIGDRTVETIGWRYVILTGDGGRRCYLDLHSSSRAGDRPRPRTTGTH